MEITDCLQCGNITPRLSSIKATGVSKQWVRRLNEETINRRLHTEDTD